MHLDNQAALVQKILEVFPGSSIVGESKLKSSRQIKNTIKNNRARAERAKSRSPILRASKSKGVDPRQLSLFDEAGGVK